MSLLPTGTNVCLVLGTLTRPPELRTLPSGTRVLTLDVRVDPSDGPTEVVPVAWHDPTPAAAGWPVGEAVVVAGRVTRRFFRAGGSTQSRTEVRATAVVPVRQRARAARVVAEAQRLLQAG